MLWHSFHSAPLAGLALLVCLATIFWCAWSLRRCVYDTLDRYLLGFIGLLAVYQGLRLLKEKNILVHPGYLYDFEEEDVLVLSLLVPEEELIKGTAELTRG